MNLAGPKPGSQEPGADLAVCSKTEILMGLASYKIVGSDGEWRIQHDGRADNVYQTKEGAFEAAVAAASLALRQGTRCG
jgi:hypothetical protein